jgi:hypothetical protein
MKVKLFNMKRILYLLLFIPFGVFGQTSVVNVGTTANDHTGDPLRTAFQKVNTNFSAVRDSFGNIYRESQTRNRIHDSLNQLRTDAEDLGTYAWLKTDTLQVPKQVVTYNQLQSFEGTGGAVGMYQLRGIIGTTSGFPVNGDSLIINTGFTSHPHITVYREGQMQWQNITNVKAPDGYKFDIASGTLTFKPILATGEQIIVHAFDPIVWHDLIPEGGSGGGGGSGESTLLTGILGFYQFDETAGTDIVDATGTQNGYTSAIVNQTGKFGKAESFSDPVHVATIPFNSSQILSGSTVSLSAWVYLTSLQSTVGNAGFLIRSTLSASPWETMMLYIDTDDKAYFNIKNTSGTDFTVHSSGTLSAGQWYHLVGICNGANPLKLYLNGADVSTSADTFSGTIYVNTSNWYMGNEYSGGGTRLAGRIDAVGIWSKAVSAGEVTELYTSTYPFN